IEALTYRIGAHSTSDDPTRYRSNEEVEAWKKKDPLDRLRKHLAVRKLVTDASDADLDAALTKEIGDAVREVEAMPPNDRASLFDDVYAVMPWNIAEQRELLLRSPPAATHG
ncbi:MAG: thiamine pyrophosphate-dependent enzyme, partial [Polyangiaceae bacterium]